jgi:hypothetical protein
VEGLQRVVRVAAHAQPGDDRLGPRAQGLAAGEHGDGMAARLQPLRHLEDVAADALARREPRGYCP